MKYTVFPTIDLQEVPQEEIDKRNLVPRKSVNESKTLMKCQHYAELFPHKMIKTIADDGTEDLSFPYPTYEGEDLNVLLSSPEWSSSDSIL
jgi:hypothetical protein